MDLSSWAWAGAGVAGTVVAVTVAVGTVQGVALASWGRFPTRVGVLVSVLVPVLGPTVLAVVALVRSGTGAGRLSWADRGRWTIRGTPIVGRRVRLAVLAAGALGIGALLVVPVARLHAGAAFSTFVYLSALPGGAALLGVSFVLTVLVAAVAARRTTRLGAVGAAVLGGCWTTLAAAVLLLAVPLTGVLDLADRYLGNALAGVLLSVLRSSDVPAAGVVSDVRDSVSTRLGAGVWVALVAGVVLLAWSLLEVLSARRIATTAAHVPEVAARVPAADPVDGWSF